MKKEDVSFSALHSFFLFFLVQPLASCRAGIEQVERDIRCGSARLHCAHVGGNRAKAAIAAPTVSGQARWRAAASSSPSTKSFSRPTQRYSAAFLLHLAPTRPAEMQRRRSLWRSRREERGNEKGQTLALVFLSLFSFALVFLPLPYISLRYSRTHTVKARLSRRAAELPVLFAASAGHAVPQLFTLPPSSPSFPSFVTASLIRVSATCLFFSRFFPPASFSPSLQSRWPAPVQNRLWPARSLALCLTTSPACPFPSSRRKTLCSRKPCSSTSRLAQAQAQARPRTRKRPTMRL